jgi:hypothetical protein
MACCALRNSLISLPTGKSRLASKGVCRLGSFDGVLSMRQSFFLCAWNAVLLVQVTRRPPTLLSRVLMGARTARPLNGLIWPKDGCALIA